MGITRDDIENHLWEKAFDISERLALAMVTALEFIRVKAEKNRKKDER